MICLSSRAAGAVYLNFKPAVIPEPSLLLALAGLAGLVIRRRKSRGLRSSKLSGNRLRSAPVVFALAL
jgi:hypothetical protein